MPFAPYIIISEHQGQPPADLQERITAAFAGMSCQPDESIIPAAQTEHIIVIECVENKPQYSAYLTAWLTDDLKQLHYYITVFNKKEGKPVMEAYFDDMGAYHNYRDLWPDTSAPFELQYENLLDAYVQYRMGRKS